MPIKLANPKGDFGRKKKNNLSKLFIILLFVLVIGAIYIFISYNNFKEKVLIKNDLMIKIENTDNLSNLGNKIKELNTIWYKIYIKSNKPDFALNAGMYQIKGNSNINGIFEGLQKSITEEINVTILEGRNIFDIDEYLAKQSLIEKGEYINYVRNPEKIKALSEFFPFIENQETFEGFLYPDTYRINVNDFKINEFVIKQLETFETKVYDEILSNLNIKEITDLVTLASIVENEEKNLSEKPTVAGILKKRLDNNWQIGADITVCYSHEITSKECTGKFIAEHVKEENEYNTRTMTGLPKTPIGNPSFETINATLNYKESEYWYYLHNINTGKIYYGRTSVEHEANKQYMY